GLCDAPGSFYGVLAAFIVTMDPVRAA
ncbi:MAG: hypothetical protein ACI9MC_003225, partial [Kiritimatiellia bacterium]